MTFTPPSRPILTDEQIEASKRADDARDRLELSVKMLNASGIPEHYKAARVDRLDSLPPDAIKPYTAAMAELMNLIGTQGMVAMIGTVGPGKTWMACALVREFCRLGRRALYIEAMDYFLALQATFGDTGKSDAGAVEEKHIKPDLLVLDAMEERADSAWNDRMLVRLINKRYAADKSTVLISNETQAAFSARVGPSISDRIKDGGGVIVCNWKSLRGRIKA